MVGYTSYVYPELNEKNELGVEPHYPKKCPVCRAAVKDEKFDHYTGPTYECGGQYTYKSQIQNHTNKWWGTCPVQKELDRKEHGRPCDNCGSKRLEGTGFPIESFGWSCNKCGYDHAPVKRVVTVE